MSNNQQHTIAILAYGSLIDNPGDEIKEIEIDRISCVTPFNVEFARLSSTRGDAPTIIPVEVGGKSVNAVLIIINPDVTVEMVESILWRRETHQVNSGKEYSTISSSNYNKNKVIVKHISNFMNIDTVLYTSLGSNIEEQLTGEFLANSAIKSILGKGGKTKKDGIRYLLAAKKNGIVTALSEDYEQQILKKTNCASLENAIEFLDKKREEDN